MTSQSLEEIRVYVGTYTSGGSEGIYLYRMDPSTGALERGRAVARDIANPSFVALDPQGRTLYSVEEMGYSDNEPSGAVSAFSIDPETGDLTHLNRQPSGGDGPCHLSVDGTGRYSPCGELRVGQRLHASRPRGRKDWAKPPASFSMKATAFWNGRRALMRIPSTWTPATAMRSWRTSGSTRS